MKKDCTLDWKPVPVRDVSVLWGLRHLSGQSEFVPTGEWTCTTSDIETLDLPAISLETCRVYHRTRDASQKHCTRLQRV